MNYENQLKQFAQDYATSIFGDKDIICAIEHEQEDKKISLYAHGKDGSKLILEYNYENNHGVDETDGTENRKYFLEKNPLQCITEYVNTNHAIRSLFARYCQIFSVNYLLSDLPFTVESESHPQKEMAIVSNTFSTEYRKICLVNSVPFQYAVEVYLKDSGNMLCQMLIENISEN